MFTMNPKNHLLAYLWTGMLLILAVLWFSLTFTAGLDINILVDGKEVAFDSAPFAENNRTYVPARFVAEELGAVVTWEQETQTAIFEKDGTVLELLLGSKIYILDGEYEMMDVVPLVRNQRTMVPARYVAEAFGAKVSWDQETYTVVIETPEYLLEKSGSGADSGEELNLSGNIDQVADAAVDMLKDPSGTQVATYVIDGDQKFDIHTGVNVNNDDYDIQLSMFDYFKDTFDGVWSVLYTMFGYDDAAVIWTDLVEVFENDNVWSEAGTVGGYDYLIKDNATTIVIYFREAI